jgi:predicted Zn finger-like uncharacterized protein
MIITCPSCSARYVVDPAKIGAAGRTVKCAKCAHAWAQPAPTPEEVADSAAAAPAERSAAATAPIADDAAEAIRNRVAGEASEPDDGGFDDREDTDFRSNFEDAFHRDPEPSARPQGRGSRNLPAIPDKPSKWPARIAWIALIVVIAGVAGSAILFQDSITKSWPASKQIYGLVGGSTEAPAKKLGVRSVQYTYPTPTTLKIEGELVNLSKAPQNVPNLRVLFLDAGGKVVKRWTFPPRERRMLPDEVIKFVTVIQNPPADAKRIDVGLDDN